MKKLIRTSLIAATACGLLAGATVVADSLWANVSIAETLRPDYLLVDTPTVQPAVAEGPATVEEELAKDWVETRRRPSRCF